MTNSELAQTLDYILNRGDDASIKAAAARRRDISMFGGTVNVPDPRRIARELSGQINAGVGAGIESLKKSARDMAARIIKEHAPKLNNAQIEELCRAWLPGDDAAAAEGNSPRPRDMMLSMIGQFVSFSKGTMSDALNNSLRAEIGAWPNRYWKVFPPVVRSIIADYLKDKITERGFNARIGIALEMRPFILPPELS
jgi:hypothetical protein